MRIGGGVEQRIDPMVQNHLTGDARIGDGPQCGDDLRRAAPSKRRQFLFSVVKGNLTAVEQHETGGGTA